MPNPPSEGECCDWAQWEVFNPNIIDVAREELIYSYKIRTKSAESCLSFCWIMASRCPSRVTLHYSIFSCLYVMTGGSQLVFWSRVSRISSCTTLTEKIGEKYEQEYDSGVIAHELLPSKPRTPYILLRTNSCWHLICRLSIHRQQASCLLTLLKRL